MSLFFNEKAPNFAGGDRARWLAGASALALVSALAAPEPARAVDATWQGATSDFNTAGNWNPASVPTNSNASFTGAGVGSITLSADSQVNQLIFSGAQSYTITTNSSASPLRIVGAGVTDSSGVAQTLSATSGGFVQFTGAATAADLVLTAGGGVGLSFLQFGNTSTATNAQVQLSASGVLAVQTTGALPLGSLSGQAGSVVLFATTPTPGLTVGSLNTSTSFAGSIQQNGGVVGSLTKVGSGTLTLSGVGSYSGGTTISAGKLVAAANTVLGTGGVTISSGATLGVQSAQIANTVAVSGTTNIVVTGTSSLGAITGTGALTISGTSGSAATDVLTLNSANTYTASTTLGDGTLANSVTLKAGVAGAFSGNSATTVTANSVLDINGIDQSVAGLSGAGVATNSSGTAAFLTNTGASSTFDGTISGTALKLQQNGAGTLTLTGTNTYGDITAVSQGTLALSGTGSVANSLGVQIASGATFDISGTTSGAAIQSLADSGAPGGSSVVLGSRTLTLTNGSGATFSGVVSGNGGLTLTAGTQTLAGANSYLGGTSVTGGTLTANFNGAQSGISTGAVSVASGATLALNKSGGANATVGNAITGAGTVNLNFGAGNVGSVQLSNILPFAGTISLTTSGATSGKYVNASGTYASQLAIGSGTTYYSQGSATFQRGITVVGSGNTEGFGAIRIDNGASLGGAVSLLGNATIGGLNGGGSISGAVSSGVAGPVTLTVGFGGAAPMTLSGIVSDGAGVVGVTTNSNATLSGANTYTGGTTVTAGTLTSNFNASQKGVSTGAVSVASGATLKLNKTAGGDVTVGNTITGAGAVNLNFASTAGGNTFVNGLSGFTGTVNLTASTVTADKFRGNSGTNAYALVINSGTTLYSQNNVTYAQGISVSGTGNTEGLGAIRIDFGRTIGGAITLLGSTTVGGLNNGGTLSGPISSGVAGPVTLTVGTPGGSALTLSGNVTDGAGVVGLTTRVNATLSGANAYTGGTTVSAGTLSTNVNLAQSGISSGPVSIASGATLRLNINDPSVGPTVNINNAITGAGTLTLNFNNLTSSGTVLNNATTFTGAINLTTSVATGDKLLLNGGPMASSIVVNSGTTFFRQNSGSFAGGISVVGSGNAEALGAIRLDFGSTLAGTVALQGNATVASFVGGGTLSGPISSGVAGPVTLTVGSAGASAAMTLSGVIGDGAGALALRTLVDTTLTSDNTYTGGTTIVSGKLSLGAGGTTGFILGNVNTGSAGAGGTLAFNRSDNTTFAGDISGVGGVTQDGGATTTLTGSLTYTGQTNVNAGAIQLGDATHSVTLPGGATIAAGGGIALDNGSLGSGTIDNTNGGNVSIGFTSNVAATAGSAVINNAGNVLFQINGAGGTARINNTGFVNFLNNASAGSAVIVNTNPGAGVPGVQFFNTSTAAGSTITINDQTSTFFTDTSTAGSSQIDVKSGGLLVFQSGSTAGSATITTAAGAALDGTGTMYTGLPPADTSRHIVNAGGLLDISQVGGTGVSIGSLEGGGGLVGLGVMTLTVGSLNTSTSYAGVIQDASLTAGATGGGLTKIGTGTLTLSGANSYTGATTVSAGALALSGAGSVAGSSAVNIATGASFDISATTSGATIRTLGDSGATPNGAVVLGSRTLTLANAGSTFSGVISGAGGGLTVSAGTETLAGANTFSGATTITAGAFLLLTGSGTLTFSAVNDGGTFDITGVTTGASVASLGGAGNVLIGSKTLTIANASGTFSGSISGAPGVLTLAGGTQTLASANSYGGGTNITGGTLIVSNNSALGTGGVDMAQGTRLGLVGVTIANSVTGHGDPDILVTGAVSMPTYLGDAATTWNILGQSNNVATDVLTVTTAGATFAGVVNVGGAGGNPATLKAGAVDSFGTGARVAVFAGSILDLNTSNQQIASVSGAGNVALGGNTLTLGNAAGDFSGAISGAGGFTVAGGAQTLSGANGYTGATTIAAGATLNLTGTGSIAASSGVLDSGTFDISGTSAGATVRAISGAGAVALGARTLTVSNAAGDLSGVVSGTGGFTLAGGAQTLSGANTFSGGVKLSGGSLTVGVATVGTPGAITSSAVGTGTLTFDGGALVAGGAFTVANAGALNTTGGTIDSNGNVFTYSGAIANGNGATGALTVAGTGGGRVVLSGANSYTGATNVGAGATLALSGAGSVAASSGVANAGTFDISATAAGASVQAITGAGNVALGSQRLTITNASGSLSGVIGGTGGVTLTAGTQTVSGANSYSGATDIQGGVWKGGAANAFSAGSATQVGAAGTLDLGGFSQVVSSLSGAGAVTNSGATTATLTNRGASSTFSGVIQSGTGTTNLTQDSAGNILTLTGANTAAKNFTGAAVVNAGALQVDGTFGDVVGNAVTVQVRTGATLSGAGRVAGQVAVDAGGQLSVGGLNAVQTLTSAATLAINGNLTLSTGATAHFLLSNPGAPGAPNSLLTVGGDLSIGNVTLDINNGGAVASGYYDLANVAGDITLGTLTLGAGRRVYKTPAGAASNEQLILFVAGAGPLTQIWDGNKQTGGAGVLAGDGTWDATRTNWTIPGGSINDSWQSQYAVFGTNAGTVTVSGVQSFQNLAFTTTGYRLISGGLRMTGDPLGVATQSTIDTGAAVTARIDTALTGSAAAIGLNKTGAGTLQLGGVNGYTGATTVGAGTLAIVGAGSVAASSSVALASGTTFDISQATGPAVSIATLANTAAGQTGTVALGANTLRITNGSTSFAGAIADAGLGGGLQIAGGTQTLTGTNTYTGVTTVDAGATLIVSASGAITQSRSMTNSGVFTVDGAATFANAGDVTNNAGATINGGGVMTAVSVVNSGAIALSSGLRLATALTNNAGGTISAAAGNAVDATTGASTALVNAAGAQIAGSLAGVVATSTGANTISLTNNGVIAGGAGAGVAATGADGLISIANDGFVSTGTPATTAGLVAVSTGTGAILITGGGQVTEGGVLACATSAAAACTPGGQTGAGAGGITITVSGATTRSAGGAGVAAAILGASNGSAILVNGTGAVTGATGGVAATTAGAGSVTVSNTGAVAVTGTGAIPGQGVLATSQGGDVTVAPASTVAGFTNGIEATTNGAGAVTVTTAGLVTGATGFGVRAQAGAGAVTLNLGEAVSGQSGAVSVSSTGAGPIQVTTGGALTSAAGSGVSTTAVDANSTATINAAIGSATAPVGAAGVTQTATGSGGNTAILNASVNAATNAVAQTSASGANLLNLAANLSVASPDGITQTTASGSNTAIIAAGGVVTGLKALSQTAASGASSLSNSGTLAGITGGVKATATGAGIVAVTNTASGVIRADNGAGVRLSTAAGGATNGSNAGAISGLLGVLIEGAGGGAFSNSGAITSVAGGVALISDGPVTFANSGTVTAQTQFSGVVVGGAGTFNNAATGRIVGGATVAAGGTLVNLGALSGGVQVATGGQFSQGVSGTVSGQLTNAGAAQVTGATDTIVNTGAFMVTGPLTVAGDVQNNMAGAFVNNGSVTAATVANSGGTFVTTGTLAATASVINSATMQASGVITTPTLTNSASFTVADALKIGGDVINIDLGRFDVGAKALSGVGVFANRSTDAQAASVTVAAGGSLGAAEIRNEAGVFATLGALAASGSVSNFATMKAQGGIDTPTLNNSGDFTVTGDLSVGASFAGARFVNTKTVNGSNQTLTVGAGSGVFVNSGDLNLTGAATTDVFTIKGNYQGVENSTIGISLPTGATETNKIVVTGNASGVSTLNVKASNPDTPVFLTKPVVFMTTGNAASATQFKPTVLLNGNSVPATQLVTYKVLTQGNNYLLFDELNGVAVGGVAGGIASAVGAAQAGFFQGSTAFVGTSPGAQGPSAPVNYVSGGVWTRDAAGVNIEKSAVAISSTGVTVSTPLSTISHFSGEQVGGDFAIFNMGGTGWNLHTGVTGGEYNASSSSPGGNTTGFRVPFLGAYAVLTGHGFNANLLVRHDFWYGNVNDAGLGLVNSRMNGQGDAITAEIGYQINLPNGMFLKPTAGFSYNRARFDGLSGGSAAVGAGAAIGIPQFNMSIGPVVSELGVISLQAGYPTQAGEWALIPNLVVSGWREFAGAIPGSASSPNVAGGTPFNFSLATARVGTFGQIGAGLAMSPLKLPNFVMFGRADYRMGSSITGGTFTFGARYSF